MSAESARSVELPYLSQKPAGEVLLDCLEEQGIRHVFGNPGTTEQGFIASVARRETTQYMLALHETVAVAMADGYARLTRRPAFVNLHISAGLANGLSQLQNAHVGRSPLVVTAGQSDTRHLVEEPLLAANTCDLAAQFTKWTWELRHATDLPVALGRALKVASDPPAGPVFLSLPMDLLDVEIPAAMGENSEVFTRVRSDADGIDAAVELLRMARRPLLLCGDGVGRTRAVDALVRLAETLGASVFSVGQSEVSFPNDHDLFVRTINVNSPKTRELLADADLYFAIGTPLFSQFLRLDSALLSPGIPLIHLDESGWEVGKTLPATVGLVGDIGLACHELSDTLEATMSVSERSHVAERSSAAHDRKHAGQERLRARFDSQSAGLTNLRLMTALRSALPGDAIVVEEAPTSAGALQQVFSFSRPDSLFAARGGALGWGLPGALGVHLAAPDRVVVAVVGDGAALYGIQALWTAAHYRLPVKFVIANNRGYGILKTNLGAYLGGPAPSRFLGMDMLDPEVNFVALAEGFGVEGQRIVDSAELGAGLERALETNGPYLVDVRIAE